MSDDVTDEATPPRRGRKKGLGKVPGSGRKARDSDAKIKEAITAFHLDIVEGKPQRVAGPLGSRSLACPALQNVRNRLSS